MLWTATIRLQRTKGTSGTYGGVLQAADRFEERWHKAEAERSTQRHTSEDTNHGWRRMKGGRGGGYSSRGTARCR